MAGPVAPPLQDLADSATMAAQLLCLLIASLLCTLGLMVGLYRLARLVATAEGVQVLYDYAAERPQPLPDDVIAQLEAFEGRPLRAQRG